MARAPRTWLRPGPGALSSEATAVRPILEALPFLPAGRGALILILGGLLVLPLSLLLARRVRPAPRPLAFRTSNATWLWVGTALEQSLREAVGPTQLVASQPGRYVVRLVRCGSCARGSRSCRVERRALERASRLFLARAAVVQRTRTRRDGPGRGCTFEIRGKT